MSLASGYISWFQRVVPRKKLSLVLSKFLQWHPRTAGWIICLATLFGGTVYYLILTSALCALFTPDLCTFCITYSWPLHFVHYLLLTSALCALLILDLCTLCITFSRPLYFVLYCTASFLYSMHPRHFINWMSAIYSKIGRHCFMIVSSNEVYSVG